MNGPLCRYCQKPIYLNQSVRGLAAHMKCWLDANPADKPCWECRGEGKLPAHWKQGVGTGGWRECPICKGTGKIR